MCKLPHDQRKLFILLCLLCKARPLIVGQSLVKLCGIAAVAAAVPAFEDIVGSAPDKGVKCFFVAQIFDTFAQCKQNLL